VEGLVPVTAKDYTEITLLMDQGSKARTVGETKMNKTSSRAHTLFTLIFTQGHVNPQTKKPTQKVSKITLVDLAGSERMDSTGATGDRAKEGANINQSLSELGNCISALALKCSGSNPNQFIPYRNSQLTFIMKESLGGNSKTAMIAAISPASINYSETLSTLRYAQRAKQITNKAKVNEDPQERMIKSLQEEIARLNGLIQHNPDSLSPTVVVEKDEEAEKRALELQEEIDRSRVLIAELQMSNEEKEKRSNEIAQERLETLKGAGLVSDSSFNRKTDFHLINLNEDPQINENLIYALNKPKILIGYEKEGHTVDISLSGVGVGHDHCEIEIITEENNETKVTVTPRSQRATYVNGKKIEAATELHNGDRIAIGSNQIFRFVNPLAPPAHAVDWDVAVREMADNLAKEKTQEALKEYQNQHKIHEEMLSILQDINSANEMADRIKKNVEYQIKVATDEKGEQKIVIHVREEDGLWEATWEKGTFLDRFQRMPDRYAQEKDAMKNGLAAELPPAGDPFIDEQAAGTAPKPTLKKVDITVYEEKIAMLEKQRDDIMMEYNTEAQETAWLRDSVQNKDKALAQRDIMMMGKERHIQEAQEQAKKLETELQALQESKTKTIEIENLRTELKQSKRPKTGEKLPTADQKFKDKEKELALAKDRIVRLEGELERITREAELRTEETLLQKEAIFNLNIELNTPRDDGKDEEIERLSKNLGQANARIVQLNREEKQREDEANERVKRKEQELQRALQQLSVTYKDNEYMHKEIVAKNQQIRDLENHPKNCCVIA
jgi:pSer/pThr/pTyr-binding forkhead associated (FHA) protein